MQFLPLFFDVKGKCCLVVGGGTVALRKISLLHKAGAVVRVVAPAIHADIQRAIAVHGGVCVLDAFLEKHLNDCVLVIAATNDDVCNATVARCANMQNIPVNVVDKPVLCRFIFPSIVERGAITVAVSSAGTSPVMTRLLRARLEAWLPPFIADMATLAGKLRQKIKKNLPDNRMRMRFWESVLESSLIGAVGNASFTLDEAVLLQKAQDFSTLEQAGDLYVIELDSGDPDLLRFRDLRFLQAADVLVFSLDIYVNVVDLARRDAARVQINNARDAECFAANKSRSGLRVVLLKNISNEVESV